MSYRLNPALLPKPDDAWFRKVVHLVGAVVLAVEDAAAGATDKSKRNAAIDLFMKYAHQLDIDIPYIPQAIERQILRRIAGMFIDWSARFVKRLRSI